MAPKYDLILRITAMGSRREELRNELREVDPSGREALVMEMAGLSGQQKFLYREASCWLGRDELEHLVREAAAVDLDEFEADISRGRIVWNTTAASAYTGPDWIEEGERA